jgi:hypothetical protein
MAPTPGLILYLGECSAPLLCVLVALASSSGSNALFSQGQRFPVLLRLGISDERSLVEKPSFVNLLVSRVVVPTDVLWQALHPDEQDPDYADASGPR